LGDKQNIRLLIKKFGDGIDRILVAGFAARELSVRIKHAEPKVIISASCGVEPTRLIR
jgi:propionyl-CoA synthetase